MYCQKYPGLKNADESQNRSQNILNFEALLYRLIDFIKSLVRNLENTYKKPLQVSYGLMLSRTRFYVYTYLNSLINLKLYLRESLKALQI